MNNYGARALGREITDEYGVVDPIVQVSQGAVMAVRMMPVGQVFQRFPRLVRDLARKLGKQVDLVITGKETEAENNVIESLFDPPLHMVRNSLDHGIEPPAEREANGKPLTATLTLAARQDGDQAVVEIIDDGRGIDPEVAERAEGPATDRNDGRLPVRCSGSRLKAVPARRILRSPVDHLAQLRLANPRLSGTCKTERSAHHTLPIPSPTGSTQAPLMVNFR